MTHRVFELGGRVIDGVGIGLKRLRNPDSFTFRLVVASLLDGFADAGKGFGAVAGVETGGVNEVLEPRPAWQALIFGESTFELEKLIVQ